MTGSAADDLNLRFPSDSSYLGISRLNATAVAASAGFNVDELDDLRLAVGEGMAWLLHCGGDDAVVDVRMTCAAGRFELVAVVEGPAIGDDEPDDLVHAILGATVDRYQVERQVDESDTANEFGSSASSGSFRLTLTLIKTASQSAANA